MPKNNENFNSELEGFLRANGFNKIATLDADGEAVPDAAEADQFKFNYVNGDYDYGTVTITTNNGKVVVYYNESVVKDPEHSVDTNWTKFLMKLKDWSLRNGQMGFSIQNLDRLGVDMRKRKIQKKEENLLEGYYGTRHTSYSDNTPTIKMIIKHSRALDEGDQRYRNIEKIFLENELGERVLVPTKKPSVGRAFARHLAEGGQYNDDRWNHIREIAEDIGKLGGFVRATRNGQFNESVASVVNEAANHYQSLRETIKRISGSRGYNHYFESWQPTLMETQVEQDYAGMFSASRLDPRIESAIPVLKKLNISVGELSEASEFEAWANSIVEGRSPEMDKNIDDLVKLLQGDSELPVGADAMSIKGQIEDIITDADHRDLLFSELEDSARADPDNDAKPAIISWLQKHRDEEFYGDVLDKLGKNEPVPGGEIAKAPEPKKAAPQQPAAPAPGGDGAEQFMPQPLAEKAKKPAQRNFVAKHAQRSGAGAHGKQGYQRHPKHKSKLGEEDVAEAKPSGESTHWRVEQSEATGRYYVVTGYQKRKVWKNKLGAIDFISKDAAQKKADELNGGVEEGRVQQLPTRGADYSKYDTDHLKMMLRPGILHRDEAKFKALIRKELQKREQQGQQGVAEGLEDSNIQDAIIDTVERLFRNNDLQDYDSLEAIRQGVKHYFSKPGATAETAIEGILNILDKRMRKNGNYVDLSRFKEALRQGVAHKLKKQGVAEDKINEFAPNGDSGGDILKTLARNWVAGDMMSGDLNSDIASQEKVESTLRHGIVCPDGVKRKLNIDWNENYDGVVLFDDEDWSIQYNIDRDLSENVMEQSEDMSQIMRIKKLSGL